MAIKPKYQKGDTFVTVSDMSDPASIATGVYVREDADYIYGEGKHDIHHKAFCFPLRYEPELRAVVVERQRLKKAFDDSMALVYQLCNKITRDHEV